MPPSVVAHLIQNEACNVRAAKNFVIHMRTKRR